MSKGEDRLYLGALGFTLALSSIVKWEPAAFDILMVLLIVWGAAAGYLSIKSIPKWPVLCLSLLLIPNVIFIIFNGWTSGAIHFFGITLYGVVIWLFFVLIMDHFKIEGFHYVLYGYAVSALASAVAGLVALFFFRTSSPLIFGWFRVQGLFKDPNVFGPYMVPIVLFSLAVLWQGAGKKRLFWIPAFVFCNIGVILSFSRAAVLNLVLALAVFLILYFYNDWDRHARRVKQVVVAGILLTALFLGLVLSNSLLGKALVHRARIQTYDTQRFATYQQALHLSIENPWGIGPGQARTRLPIDTHNICLRVSLENGWPGLIGLIGFLAISVYNAWRMAIRRNSRFRVLYICITAALIGILANSMFIDTLHWRHFWVIFALAWVDFDSSNSVWY